MLGAEIGNFLTGFSKDAAELSKGLLVFADTGLGIFEKVTDKVGQFKDVIKDPQEDSIKRIQPLAVLGQNSDNLLMWGAIGVFAFAVLFAAVNK